MSRKKIYEVFSEDDICFKPLETKRIRTNIFLEKSENECVLFNTSDELFSKHGLFSMQSFIEEEIDGRLCLKFVKICPIQMPNLGVVSVYEQTFGIDNEFRLTKGTFLGKLVLFNFD